MPSDHREWNALAWSYLQSGQSELALDAARRAHEASRGNLDYLNTLGVAYGELGELERAESSFRKALKRRPVFLDALINLAKTLEKQERFAESIPLYERALALDETYPRLATNLARLYRLRGDASRARGLLERLARQIEPQDLALSLAECDASPIDRLARAVGEHPDWLLARNALAHALLANGEWRQGWRHFAARRALFDASALAPAVLPRRLDGERILLRGDQGLGDVLFFLRFAPLLRQRGARISLLCERKLHGLITGMDAVMAEEAGSFERRVWLSELPAQLECDETPSAWPLAVSDDARAAARARLAALGKGPYLAVTWRAGTDTARGREFGFERASLSKAVPPAELGAALRGWPGTIIALQRGGRSGEAAQFGLPLHDLSFLGEDLPALLGVLAVVDEYVSVSNTNVHLLAGIGKSARVLVPYPAEWRWLRREGRSPWFPEFPVYRQTPSRDWSATFKQLREDLHLV